MLKRYFILIVFIVGSFNLKSQTQPNLDHWHGDSVDVIHYDIHLDFVSMYDRSISGYTELTLKPVVESFDEFALDLLKMTIDSIFLDGEIFTNFTYNDTILHFNLSETLSHSEELILKIYYHGKPKKDPLWGGFFMTDNYVYNVGVGMGSDPVCFGRCWYPCVDDFLDRATHDYYITIPDQFDAACSGIKIDEIDHEDNSKTAHWRSNQRIPTYLSSIAIGDYSVLEDIYQGMEKDIPIQNYVYPDDYSGAINSLQNLKEVMSAFEELFGPYQFDRVGYVAVPFSAGAMEHAMNIAISPDMIDGTLNSETTLYHELSHMWFGDWVTCKTANEMWLNEGWASYCEPIFLEHIYGKERAKEYIQSNHDRVLKSTHNSDGDFYAVANVPLDQTYGSTSYDKGSDRVHTLRGYLGDELFYQAVKQYLIEFGDSVASSADLRDVITDVTGIDMTDFFEGWIYSPGFPHYSVDSYSVDENSGSYDVTVYVKQKLRAQDDFINSNRVELSFMDDEWNQKTELIQFDGEFGSQTFTLDFFPEAIFLDHHEKLSDAISNNIQVMNEAKTYYSDNTYLTMYVDEIQDSAYVSTEFNWVAPDKAGEQENGMIITDYFYWKVSGILPETYSARGKFFFNLNFFTDDKEKNYKFDTLRLVYREDALHKWRYVPQTFSGTHISGEITVLDIQLGEYALANNVWPINVLEKKYNTGHNLKIFPNPADENVTIIVPSNFTGELVVTNNLGQSVYSKNISNYENPILWKPEKKYNGLYYVSLFQNNQVVENKKLLLY